MVLKNIFLGYAILITSIMASDNGKGKDTDYEDGVYYKASSHEEGDISNNDEEITYEKLHDPEFLENNRGRKLFDRATGTVIAEIAAHGRFKMNIDLFAPSWKKEQESDKKYIDFRDDHYNFISALRQFQDSFQDSFSAIFGRPVHKYIKQAVSGDVDGANLYFALQFLWAFNTDGLLKSVFQTIPPEVREEHFEILSSLESPNNTFYPNYVIGSPGEIWAKVISLESLKPDILALPYDPELNGMIEITRWCEHAIKQADTAK